MVPLDYVLAVALLVCNPEEVTPHVSRNLPDLPEHGCLSPSLVQLGLSWELIDPRETHTFYSRDGAFLDDTLLLRRRQADLADAPPCSDSLRFPTNSISSELLSFNRAYHTHLRQQRETLGDAAGNDAALEENDRLYHIWDLVRDAGSDCYYISVRRQALDTLRRLLGEGDYLTAKLPPHVPIWRFNRD